MIKTFGAAAIALVLLGCCGGGQVIEPSNGPRSAAELIATVVRPQTTTLQGTGRLVAYTDGERRSATVLVVAARPKSMQIQALTPTLDLIAVVSSDGERFLSYERGSDKCWVGKACPRNLARILPLPLPADGLVAALLGDLPLLPAPVEQQQLSWDGEKSLYRLQLGAVTALHQQVFVQPKDWRIVGAVWFFGDQRLASLQYDGELAPLGPPRIISVKTVTPKADLTLELREVQLNAPVDPTVFAVACPEGTVQAELPCEDK